MRFKLDQVLKDRDGKPHTRTDAKVDSETNAILYYPDDHPMAGRPIMEYKGPLLLSDVLYSSLNQVYQDDKLTVSESLQRGRLAEKVHDEGEKNFNADEVKMMTECLVKAQVSPSILLQVLRIIDPHHKDLQVPEEGPVATRT